MKKKMILLLVVLCICVTVVGCQLIRAEKQTLPAVTEQEVAQAVLKFLPKKSKLISPTAPKRKQQLIRKDMDGDEIAEGIAFFSTDTIEGIGVLIVKRNQKMHWVKYKQMFIKTSSFFYGAVFDVTKDGNSELVIVIQDEKTAQKRLLIYQLRKNNTTILLNKPYDQKVIYDFESDGSLEIVLFTIKRDQRKKKIETIAEVYDYRGDTFIMSHRLLLKGDAKPGNIHVGKVNEQEHGIFVDLDVGSRGGGVTELLFPTKGVLMKAFDGEESFYHFKLINEPSRDINHDGMIEFALIEQPMGSIQQSTLQSPFVYQWYQWTIKDQRKLVAERYQDVEAGFHFDFGEKWLGKTTPKFQAKHHQVNFYYHQPNQPLNQQLKLFRLLCYSQTEWGKIANKSPTQIVLKRANKMVYVAVLPTAQERSKLSRFKVANLVPTVAELRKQFHLFTPQAKKQKQDKDKYLELNKAR